MLLLLMLSFCFVVLCLDDVVSRAGFSLLPAVDHLLTGYAILMLSPPFPRCPMPMLLRTVL